LKYYLSGAITYQPDFKEYFAKYESGLRNKGVTDIFNPADITRFEDMKWETRLKYDLKFLVDCDCIVLLPNWRVRRGSQLEIYVAKSLGIRVVEFTDIIQELTINAS
jgi:hypothetical protein